MDADALTFGTWLQRRRKAFHLTQQQLAEHARCSTNTIRKLETDQRRPSPEIARLLAIALHIPEKEHRIFVHFARGERANAPALPTDTPGRPSHVHSPSNIPVPLTPLVGREAECVAIRRLLLRGDVRMVTLTGPGGVGKTRLSFAVVAGLRDAFADGVRFVNLAPLTEPELVLSTIAHVLEVKESGGQELLASVQAHLRDLQVLLLLDNFEQVLAAGLLIAKLLEAAPGLAVLATSRSPLHLRGEHEVAVQPLALPGTGGHDLATLTQYDAVRLFVARAQAVNADFQVTNANAPSVAEICARLDGLPLAIELAAARVKLLPPEALLQKLSHRLQILTGGHRDLPARQQTIRAAINWSYQLLDPAEKILFSRLAVFVGGFTLEAVEAICAVADDLPFEILDGLQSLVDNNLVRQVATDELRFTMLETIREFATEQLEINGEYDTLWRMQADYLQTLTSSLPGWYDVVGGSQHVSSELDNLRAVLMWARNNNAGEIMLRVAASSRRIWWDSGYFAEGRKWLAEALARSSGPPTPQHAELLSSLGWLALLQGDSRTARAYLEQSIPLFERFGDDEGCGQTMRVLGNILSNLGEFQDAAIVLDRGLKKARAAGDRRGIATILLSRTAAPMNQGDYAEARSLFEQCRMLYEEFSDVHLATNCILGLGQVALLQGDYAEAEDCLDRAVTRYRTLDFQLMLAWALHDSGYLAVHQGDMCKARSFFGEALQLFQKTETRDGIGACLAGLARVILDQGRAERAAYVLGASDALIATIGGLFIPVYRVEQAHTVMDLRAVLDEDTFATGWNAGQDLPLIEAITIALDEYGA